ncbi:MAG: iron-containing alcohol dehydrogenase [Muribaculaceae bacterium]
MKMTFSEALRVPQEIFVGAGALKEALPAVKHCGSKALVVTGPHVGRSVMMQQLCELLEEAKVDYVTFDGIGGEPTDKMIETGVRVYRDAACDFCIGIGGGSPLDSAKAIAAMTVCRGSIADYNGKVIDCEMPKVVAIPTTAGTGSEVTKFTIVTDTERGIKMLLKGDVLLPDVAVVDFTLGMTAPKSVTAATGLDALTHAVESLISVKATDATDELAVSAVKRIMKNLPVAYANGDDAEAREQMAIAAMEAGVCINNSSVTVVHGMSRPIGALFHVPHGISNAMLLATCLGDMEAEAREKFAQLARAIGVATVADEDAVASEQFIEAVKELCRVCEVPTLREYGIDEAQFSASIEKMAADAIASGSPGNAPKAYTAADCVALYKKSFG